MSTDSSLLSSAFMARLDRLQLISRRTVAGQRRGERKSLRKGMGNEFADYRNYAPGDDLRFLDWKLYGRLEKLFVRLFQAEEDLHVSILLDTSQSMGFGNPTKLTCATRIAAALGFLSLAQSDAVSIHTFSDTARATFGPRRGRLHAPEMLRALDGLSPQGGTSLVKACEQAARTSPTRSIAILISDFLDFEGFQAAVRKLSTRDLQIIAVMILSEEERSPQLEGDLDLRDSEYDYSTEISVTKLLLRQYGQTLSQYRNALNHFLLSRGGALIDVSNNDDPEQIVLPLFRKAGLMR